MRRCEKGSERTTIKLQLSDADDVAREGVGRAHALLRSRLVETEAGWRRRRRSRRSHGKRARRRRKRSKTESAERRPPATRKPAGYEPRTGFQVRQRLVSPPRQHKGCHRSRVAESDVAGRKCSAVVESPRLFRLAMQAIVRVCR